jgi:prepilin-type N-terminal cleavage/methylation domain-containing protein
MRRCGYTLIELLVLITIASVLAAIVMPALASVIGYPTENLEAPGSAAFKQTPVIGHRLPQFVVLAHPERDYHGNSEQETPYRLRERIDRFFCR